MNADGMRPIAVQVVYGDPLDMRPIAVQFVSGDALPLEALTEVPDPPTSGWKLFLVETGTSPNHQLYLGLIDSSGNETPIFNITN